VIEKDLSTKGTRTPGRNPNRLNPKSHTDLEVSQQGSVIKYVLQVFGEWSVFSTELSLDVSDRSAKAVVWWETDAVRRRDWKDVHGWVVLDHWPVDSSDPVSLRYLLFGRDREHVESCSDALDTHPNEGR
jgi:hypothetical protein